MGDRVRVDIFLDVACLAKTRSQARKLCEGGKVEVNGERAKPHRLVGPGDRIRLTLGPGFRRELLVQAVSETHLPRREARTLYKDITPPPPPQDFAVALAPKGMGRPEKKARRALEKLRGRW